jgi:predicted nucleotidyltransferase
MSEIEALFEPLVALLRAEFGASLLGVLATGSHIHGTPGPNSDLDAHVVIAAPQRQRRNLVLQGVEVELFLNPPFRVRGYFADRHVGTLHMFTFGRPIDDPHGMVAQLQAEARAIWDAGPTPLPPREAWHPRYVLADLLRDLADMSADESNASLQLARIVDLALATHYRINRRWPEKPTRRLADIALWSPAVAALVATALAPRPLPERRAAAEQLAAIVLVPIGGLMPLEWQNDWEPLDQPPEAP